MMLGNQQIKYAAGALYVEIEKIMLQLLFAPNVMNRYKKNINSSCNM